jgi:tetratricopeptide (TPR) repeat protein
MNAEDISILVARTHSERLVILAGAGVSMDAPSSLPGWKDLNSMILSAVTGRVRSYFDGNKEVDQLCQSLIARRDEHGTFAPDYQAQIMEEQCGLNYFRSLLSLDIDQYNFSHLSIATLAAAGHIAAVVTTNFDQLLEKAFTRLSMPIGVYATTEEYAELAKKLTAGELNETPIIKIHGSVHDVTSLVDTLKQRRRGRGPALNEALSLLLSRHYWLYVGFSAADLKYDPDYLGLRGAAEVSPGFSFLHQKERVPGEGALLLKEAYGDKSRFIAGSLQELFATLLPSFDLALPVLANNTTNVVSEVSAGIDNWANALDPMHAISLLAALLEAAGQEPAALWVLHRTWRRYRTPEDTKGEEYSRYLFNYGRLALLHGETHYEETPQNFLRARDHVPEAEMWFALHCLYVGLIDYALGALNQAFEAGFDDRPAAFVIDRVLIFARFADLYGKFDLALKTLPYAYQRSLADGDEPRRGRVLAMSALHFARTGQMATEFVNLGKDIAQRLGDDVLLAELDLARAVGHYLAGELDAARTLLEGAINVFNAQQRTPLLAAATLELAKVSYELRRYDETETLLRSAFELTRTLPVYEPHLQWFLARAQTLSGNFDDARNAIAAGREAAANYKNDWMTERLAAAESELHKAERLSAEPEK